MQQMPTDAEYLREAQAWVRNWPEARVSALPHIHSHTTSSLPICNISPPDIFNLYFLSD
jgi:hypothetical protein